ncbi:hypothetical protein ACFLU6_11330 [Acidobacteriota bacterium]
MPARMMKCCILVVFVVSLFILGSSTVQAQVPLDCSRLLGCSQNAELFSIDLETGSATFIGTLPAPVTEIEYDNVNAILYAEESDGDTRLFSIDPETADHIDDVSHTWGAFTGMEFVGTTLYATYISTGGGAAPSELVIVDPDTGNFALIGLTGVGPVTGLAYQIESGTMYGVTAGSQPSSLVTIDLDTGAATIVGPTGLDRIGGLEFGRNGRLYGGVAQNASSYAGYLVRINPDTGTATPIGSTGYSISGLTACLPLEPPVPVMPKLVLAIMALLLLIPAMYTMTRRLI